MTSRKLFQYPGNAMKEALKAVREENMPVATAAKKFKGHLYEIDWKAKLPMSVDESALNVNWDQMQREN